VPNRRKDTHPAIRARGLAVAEEVVDGLRPAGWEKLNHDERLFLQLLPFYGDLADTAVAIGREAKWVQGRRDKKPEFRAFLEEGKRAPEVMFRAFLADMVGKGNVEMASILDNPATPLYVRMEVIKHLHKLAGLEPRPSSGVQVNVGGQHIHPSQMTIFSNGEKVEGHDQ
jgi:hypothetical protein